MGSREREYGFLQKSSMAICFCSGRLVESLDPLNTDLPIYISLCRVAQPMGYEYFICVLLRGLRGIEWVVLLPTGLETLALEDDRWWK